MTGQHWQLALIHALDSTDLDHSFCPHEMSTTANNDTVRLFWRSFLRSGYSPQLGLQQLQIRKVGSTICVAEQDVMTSGVQNALSTAGQRVSRSARATQQLTCRVAPPFPLFLTS